MAISPDDEDKPFVARWNALVSALAEDEDEPAGSGPDDPAA